MRDLEKMFNPDSVAIIGASNKTGKVGNIIVNNIVSGGYKGKVYPINPNADGEICGIKAYKSILDIAIRPFIYYCIGGFAVAIFFPSPTVRASFGLIHILCLLIYGMGRFIRWCISKIRKHFHDPNLGLISY